MFPDTPPISLRHVANCSIIYNLDNECVFLQCLRLHCHVTGSSSCAKYCSLLACLLQSDV